MAWLSDLAGKAEEVLNNIDRTTAAALRKEEERREKALLESALLEVRSMPPVDYVAAAAADGTAAAGDTRMGVEEFLRGEERYSTNGRESDAKKLSYANKGTSSAPTTPARTRDKASSMQAESLAWLDEATLNADATRELRNGEKYGVGDSNGASKIGNRAAESYVSVGDVADSFNAELLQQKLAAREEELKAEHARELDSLREATESLTSERARLAREASDLRLALERTRAELSSVEAEFQQHRARAVRTLQEKDKLIAELRVNPQAEVDDDERLTAELAELRQEREALREENSRMCERLRVARQELLESDLNAESARQKAAEATARARESIESERRRRSEAEEDAKMRSDEVRALRDELSLKQHTLTLKLQKQESEMSRLRSQLTAAATPSSEVEKRLSSLTRTLVMKQQELEHLTTERNALRLQLEKLELEYQNWRKNLPFNNVNDTDDAKALLPSFLVESPFDTGVTRRVKRAYSSLDTAGIRIGRYLRRYPLARSFVILYMIFVQLLVLMLLYSKTPEAR